MKQQKTAILMTWIAGSKSLMDAREMITAAARQFSDVKLYAARRGPVGQTLAAHTGQAEKAAQLVAGQTWNVTIADCLSQALDQAVADGVRVLVVQPLYLLHGLAYDALMDALLPYYRHFEAIAVGKPLLACEADLQATARALLERTAAYDDGGTAICLMGHGTTAAENHIYADLQEKFRESGHRNYYLGTLCAEPSFDTVRKALRAGGYYQKVVLVPFMVFTGKHARQDLAGGQPGSWKSVLEEEGYQVSCVLEGLVQMPQVQKIYLNRLKAAMDVAGKQGRHSDTAGGGDR